MGLPQQTEVVSSPKPARGSGHDAPSTPTDPARVPGNEEPPVGYGRQSEMSIPAALFLAVAVLLLATPGLGLPYIAAYSRGFRRKALKLVVDYLQQREPDRSKVKLESHVHLRWDALIEAARRAERGIDGAKDQDRALAVLVGRDGDTGFLRSVQEERSRYQERQLCALRRRLDRTEALPEVIMRAQSWIGVRERWLFWESFREFGPQFFNHLHPRINTAVSYATATALIGSIMVGWQVALATHQNVIGAILTAATVLLGVAAIALVWMPILLRATRVQLADADPRMIRLMRVLLPVPIVLTVVVETLILTGGFERFQLRANKTVTQAVDGMTLSPLAAVVITLVVIDGIVLMVVLANLAVLIDSRVVTWERVRAGGRIIGWSCMFPISIALVTEANAGIPANGFPEWVRLWVFMCWAVALVVFLASAALRRLTRSRAV